MKIQEFILSADEVWVNIRQMHHLSRNNAEHLQLGEFYDKWAELVDSFIETYYGKYGRAEATGLIELRKYATLDPLLYVKAQVDLVTQAHNTLTTPDDIDLRNILADMKQLINHTAYRLTQP